MSNKHIRRTRGEAAANAAAPTACSPASAGAWPATSRSTPRSTASASSCSRCSAAPASSSTPRPRSSCPTRARQDSVATAALRNRRDRPWPLIGLGLLAVGGAVLLSQATLWPHGDAWIVLLIAGAAILWITRHRQGRAVPRTRTQLAARDSRRIRRVLRRARHRDRLARRARARRGGDLRRRRPRPCRPRRRRPDLRRRRHPGSPRRTTASGIGDLRLDLSDVQFPAGERRTSTRASTSAGST